jgi:hypothetical protein
MPIQFPNIKLEPNPEESVGDQSNSFTMLIGKLQYLVTATRPDIAFAVNWLAAYTANPSLIHYMAAKCMYTQILKRNCKSQTHLSRHLSGFHQVALRSSPNRLRL